MADDRVADEERLYRSVRASEILRDASGHPVRASSHSSREALRYRRKGIKAMTTVSIPEAQAALPEIVENLKPGEEIIITRNQQPVAKLIPFSAALPQPVFGSCRGKLTIVSEDEEHLEDFKVYMP